MTLLEATELWYAAVNSVSPYGVVIETDGLEYTRQKLYQAKRDANDPALDNLVIVTSPIQPETQLWIVKKDAPDG